MKRVTAFDDVDDVCAAEQTGSESKASHDLHVYERLSMSDCRLPRRTK